MSSPDAPETLPERDTLRRWPLAQTIFELIRKAPKEWSIRIGIYGRWGEGKTTVLNFVGELATRDGHPVVPFNPWAAQDRSELWRSFSLAVDEALGTSIFSGFWMRRKLGGFFSRTQPLAELHSYAKTAYKIVAPFIVEWIALKKADIQRRLLEALKDRRLIVIIDDLDRATPDLIPHLLLSLRELLDLQQCVFLIALDPDVIAQGLPAIHPGWGNTPQFLEKIIDFPFWLAEPTNDDLLELARAELRAAPVRICSSSAPLGVLRGLSNRQWRG